MHTTLHDCQDEGARPYDALTEGIVRSFAAATGGTTRLFETDADPDEMWKAYLSHIPQWYRQQHNCRACRDFIRRHGGLAAVSDTGVLVPTMWDMHQTDGLYVPAFLHLHNIVWASRITGLRLPHEQVLGQPVTGSWVHMSVRVPSHLRFRGGEAEARRAEARCLENVGQVRRAVQEVPRTALSEALRALEAEALPRSERFVGPVRWLLDAKDASAKVNGPHLLWRMVATAPEGYCHPRASVVWPLVQDIIDGVPFEAARRKFAHSVDPSRYQRPQAAPRAGNVAAAEREFERLGLARSLERRFATLAEVLPRASWRPRPRVAVPPIGHPGLFSGVPRRGAPPAVRRLELPAAKITWRRLAEEVLPEAEALEVRVPREGPFLAITAPTHPDAPPILKWDNGYAWYVYRGGSPAEQWGLHPGEMVPATAVVLDPPAWEGMGHLGDGAAVLLQGARDSATGQGNCLFPECIRGDLHPYRSTIEAYSKRARLARPRTGAYASGLQIGPHRAELEVRALRRGAWTPFTVDRWV